ncbi:PREDICTED: oncostatin-M-specific receptor subunit beta-like [Elephantulus edwardii]|uniref:oncostatin-M-specific receptor subunit beta-like n=1 Tax=Elephantulus edwardii TaxID=28737 RepID=UPI0003F0CC3B|nr:PREDICTED: oncostatin-M-specific receptor subunit beta-like [Elephantulus edwardii]
MCYLDWEVLKGTFSENKILQRKGLEVLSESLPLTPELLKISANSTHQRLDLQWHVHSHFQHQELQMIFQIQMSRIVTSNVIWVGNYSATVKGTQVLHWSWESELPLECATHFVRIRSLVGDAKFPGSRAWSNWTSWEKDNVKASLGNGHFFMFPQDKVVEEGSSVTLCYISRSNQDNIYCYLEGEPIQGEQLTPDVSMFTLSHVLFVRSTGTSVFCKVKQDVDAKGTVIYVSKILEEPKDFLCYIWDLKTLKCIWDPGNDTGLSHTSPTYTLFEASSRKKKLCKHKNWCKWKVTQKSQELYNFTLVAENSLRKRSVNSVFHLTYPVHPLSPFDLFLENVSSTSATITWKMRPLGIKSTFLCQVQLHHDRQVIQNNVSMKDKGKCLLSEMQPDTHYLVQVRCADGNYFWKWSEWSMKKLTTLEAPPSVAPDVWRLVTSGPDGYKVKLFWKPLPKFHANGKILFYNITVKSLSEPSRSELHSVPALITHRDLTLPQQHPYQICVTANNSVGLSPPAVIVIPSNSGHEEIGEERVIGTEAGIALSWRPHSRKATGYVVEWCDRPRESLCGLRWWTLGPNTTSAVISSDAFTPGVRYNFRIYEISTTYTASLIEKKTGYSQELAPSDNPLVIIDSLTPHSFSMSWKKHSTESQPGFIKGYYIYLKTKMDKCSPGFKRTVGAGDSAFCKYKINNPEQKSFVVDKLQPESFYEFLVTQYTSAGEGPNGTFTKVTTPDEHARKLLRIILPTFFCVLLVMIACYLKIQWMKEKCYPDIPDPYKSHVLSVINLKEIPHLTIMNINECRIDALEIVNKLEGSKTHSSHTDRSLAKMEPTLSVDYLSLLSTEKNPSDPRGSFGFKNSSDRRNCICFDNKTYNWKISDLDSYDQIAQSPVTTLSQRGPLKASESVVKVDKDYVNSLGGVAAGEAGLHYVSQLASCLPSDKDRLPGDAPVPAPCTIYQMQVAVPTSPASSPCSEASSRSSVALLDQCVHYG